MRRQWLVVIVLVCGGGVLWLCWPVAPARYEKRTAVPDLKAVRNRPVIEHSHGYIGSDSCRECHLHEHASWHASYHRTMTQLAAPESVIGDFGGVIDWQGKSTELWREKDEFWADLEMPTGAQEPGGSNRFQRQIVMTTGSHHMQAYWYPLLDDSPFLGLLPFIYLLDEHQWIPRQSAFLKQPVQNSDETGRWSSECIRCHATHGRMNVARLNGIKYDFHDVRTRVAELGIACEACHGPGEKHVLNRQSSKGQPSETQGDSKMEFIVHPGRLNHKQSSEVCGQCHGIFSTRNDKSLAELLKTGWRFRPGDDLEQSKMRFLHRCGPGATETERDGWENSFWSDGMVRVSGREYNGLVESPCFQHGTMSCISCHRMHKAETDQRPLQEWANDQLDVAMDEDQACIQCHEQFSDATTLVGHTHHQAASSGSRCYNCHMPYTTYGLLKAIRSHMVSSPDVEVGLKTGRPNACNQCHLDKTLDWTANALVDWYQHKKPDLSADEQTVAASVLWSLKGDAGQRALIAWSFGWRDAQVTSGTEWIAPYLAKLMEDPYDAIRFIAFRSLRRLPDFENLSYDFVGSEEHRLSVAASIRNTWRNQSKPIDSQRSQHVLMNRDRQVARNVFDRLLEERGRRPVNLFE